MTGDRVVGIDTGIAGPDQDQDLKAITGKSTKKGIEVEVTAGIEATIGAKKVRMRLLRKERLF